MASRLGGPKRFSPAVLVLAIMLVPLFAGCSDKGFFVDVPLWKAGYGWEYEQTVIDRETLRGDLPTALESDEPEENIEHENQTVRLEVFNATANSLEGIPIYALAVLNRYLPEEEEEGVEAEELWDAWVYSVDINKVEPTYLDWRNQEIQLSGEEGADEDEASETNQFDPEQDPDSQSDDGEPRPQFEDRRLDWPLEKGHAWRHSEPVPLLDGEDGVFEGRAVRQYTATVPAGKFSAIRIEGRLTADDLTELEEDVRSNLEAFGGEVDSVDVRYSTTYVYGYSSVVMNLVSLHQTDRYSIHARGEDDNGDNYDFTFTKEIVTNRELLKFQLLDGIEKPLTFALDVKRGAYEPKPITPASHLAVEIITSEPALNKAGDEQVFLGVRIYNSSAGEKTVRAQDSVYPAVGQEHFRATYDHDLLEVRWTYHDILPNNAGIGPETEVANLTGDQQVINGETFSRYGLKTLTATLKLKDTPEGPGQEIYKDVVLFEVFMRTNITGTLNATDAGDSNIRVRFPVEHTAARVHIFGRDPTIPPEGQCLPAGAYNCIIAIDAGGRNVADDRRGEPMVFETTRLRDWIKGIWSADYTPAKPTQQIVFEITVRYRPGA